MSKLKLFIFSFSLVVFQLGLGQTTIYVNSSSGNDTSGDGSSGAPYKTFHKGYTVAVSGDTINLTGIFTWSDNDESGDVAEQGYKISKNLMIVGQSDGTTIIQADTASNTASRRVLTAQATASFNSLTIKNITIRNGVSTTDGDIYSGSSRTTAAGLLVQTTTSHYQFQLNIQNCIFENNRINGFDSSNSFSGAALSFSGYAYGTLNIEKSVFKNNYAYVRSYGSGALYINQSVNAIGKSFYKFFQLSIS